jgi:HAD superfamily hydrolase (TIGR01450 family)
MTDLPALAGLDIPGPALLDAEATLQIYEALRPVLPPARSSSPHQKADKLTDCLDAFDAFILDGFGVINVGMEKIEGIDEFFRRAEQAGKPIVILTNGASAPSAVIAKKYLSWGLPVAAQHIVSSRDALVAALPPADQRAAFLQLDCNTQLINGLTSSANASSDLFDTAEAFVFLGSSGWDEDDQALLEQSLLQRIRPVLVGNPDVSAPHSHQFSAEPGYWVTRAMKVVSGLRPLWFGKPHLAAFQLAVDKVNRLADGCIPNHRIAMVGDSLHTDILGGAAAGLGTILITNYGLLRAHDAEQLCAEMQIFPDWQVRLI